MRLRWLSVVAGVGLGLSSCSFDDGGVEPDGNGAIDASVDAEPPVCTPGCEGDILVTCPAGSAQRTECDLGCIADAAPHCAVLVPSNGVTIDDLSPVPMDRPFVVPAGQTYTIDTDTGRIVAGGGAQIRPATTSGGLHDPSGTFYARRGEAIGFFAVDALTIEAGATFRGEGERALLMVSRGDVIVRGAIDVSAGCLDGIGSGSTCGGPGGGEGATLSSAAGGCAPGSNGVGAPGAGSAGSESGGGGGSLGAVGGAGGNAGETPVRPGGSGGVLSSACSGPSLVPLGGGSGGGAGGVGDVNGGVGGGGGGAIQITSLTRIVLDADGDVAAMVRANGAGGSGTVAGAQGGGGGGSGGGILLEAPTIALAEDSVLVANGGGGGSGTVASSNAAANGAAGGVSTTRAAGGIGDANEDNRGFGGLGGARSGGAGAGGSTLDGGGGGGGGVGIIRINRRTQTFGTNVVVSPAHSEGALTVQ